MGERGGVGRLLGRARRIDALALEGSQCVVAVAAGEVVGLWVVDGHGDGVPVKGDDG